MVDGSETEDEDYQPFSSSERLTPRPVPEEEVDWGTEEEDAHALLSLATVKREICVLSEEDMDWGTQEEDAQVLPESQMRFESWQKRTWTGVQKRRTLMHY